MNIYNYLFKFIIVGDTSIHIYKGLYKNRCRKELLIIVIYRLKISK